MTGVVGRSSAAAVAAALLGLVAADLHFPAAQVWWNQHSLTGAVVSSVLVLAASALIVDQVVAGRNRRDRRTSLGVQGLVLFAQVRRAHHAVLARDGQSAPSSDPPEQLWNLATMLPMASTSVFDDHYALQYLNRVERLTGLMLRVVASSSRGESDADTHSQLAAGMAELEASVGFILDRLPAADHPMYQDLMHV